MSAVEEGLVYELGALLQVVDDYQDAADDRRAGLRTTATDGAATATFLLRWLTDIEARMSPAPAGSPCRAFFDSLYLWLYTVVAIRFVRGGPVRRGVGPVPRWVPMRVILSRRAVIR
jgi:4-hydroxybenzoate polyprenyltransferase